MQSKVAAKDELTVYVNLKNPRSIYQVLPKLAKDAGLEKDGKGQYAIQYNTDLLGLYGISEGKELNSQVLIIIVMAAILLILVMGTFVLIIYNAFSISANSRIKELSVLKSLGATPKQIKYSVLYEGFLLWLVQAPVAILTGLGFSSMIFNKCNHILSAIEGYVTMKLTFSPLVIVLSLLFSLITVLLSASIPAGKMAKIPAVEGINSVNSKKKMRDHRLLSRLFGMEGELAGRQFAVNKKSLKTAVLSLALCITLVVSYLSIMSIYNLAESADQEAVRYDMSVHMELLEEPDAHFITALKELGEVKESVLHRETRMRTTVTKEQMSKEFAKAGGFDSVDMKYSVQKEKDGYGIVCALAGLDDDSFQAYCEQLGVDAGEYVDKSSVKGIVYDNTYHEDANTGDLGKVSMLQLNPGDTLSLKEQADKYCKGNATILAEVGMTTKEEPGDLDLSRYSVAFVVPMSKYQQLTAQFDEGRALESNSTTIDFQVGEKNSAKCKQEMEKLCNHYLGSDDYTIYSLLEEKQEAAIQQKATSFAVYAIAIMFGIIGLFNACSTITNNLLLHKRDYAMLRSIGVTPEGISKILRLEGGLFVLSPILLSAPIVVLTSFWMLNLTKITVGEYAKVCPFAPILVYLGAMILAIFSAYFVSSRGIKTDNVIESIQNEIV